MDGVDVRDSRSSGKTRPLAWPMRSLARDQKVVDGCRPDGTVDLLTRVMLRMDLLYYAWPHYRLRWLHATL
ncbi:hypothetical protein F6B41_23460 [Microbacterium lushaniae]|nr:hypothetical protein F6B41_23460 [Microbacterium lushaniae]